MTGVVQGWTCRMLFRDRLTQWTHDGQD